MFAFVIIRAGSGDDSRTMVKPKQFCLIFFSPVKEVAHFFLSRFLSVVTALHPG